MAESRSSSHEVLVVCPPGLEALVVGELTDLGVKHTRSEKGGVTCSLTTRQLYAANRSLRCATRILGRIARFTVRSFADLERRVNEIEWDDYLPAGVQARFRVTTRRSKLWHDKAVEERFMRAFKLVSPHASEQLFVVRGSHDRFTVSVDSSGAPLHERGWRQALAKAPLRESVAAGLLMASEWDPTTSFIDPFCGSGTLAIEAALRATGQPPGGQRQFAFKQWPDFQPGTWASVTTAQAEPTLSVPAIVATDRDAGAIDAAEANAERAGVAELIDFRVAPIADLQTPEGGPGHLVTNPPWGGRVSAERDLRNLYATLGNVGKKELSGWGLGVLLADRDLARQIRPGLNESLTLELGGQHAWFMTGKFPN